jgi:signal transduction histidine kinase
VWGHWTHVAIVLVGQVVTIAFNQWVNVRVLHAIGARFEVVRAIANSFSTVSVGYLIGWPLPVWLWPPFVALAFDRSGGRYAVIVVAVTLIAQNVVPLLDGVAWIYPLTSVAMTAYAWRISEVRVRVIRDMLVRSDQQREEIERAHDSTREALDQLKTEVAARKRVEIELRAAQKLEALGRIAAGVAHEINTPIQYVGDSIEFLATGIDDVVALSRLNTAVRRAGDDAQRAAAIAAADRAEEEADLAYLGENLPQALARAREGVERVALIVRSMKRFAYPDSSGRTHANLQQAIEATLAISRHEYKHVADVETEFGELPPVLCCEIHSIAITETSRSRSPKTVDRDHRNRFIAIGGPAGRADP